MELYLSDRHIEYLLFHLNHHIHLSADLRRKMCFLRGSQMRQDDGLIVFPLSDKPVTDKVTWIEKTPVLFPVGKRTILFELDENGTLVFEHDWMKAAFYLLSGYQETRPFAGDAQGRFCYKDSLQARLKSPPLPWVNACFEIIGKGIEAYCRHHQLPFRRRDPWQGSPAALALSHDVDRVDKWTINELKLRIKWLIGLNPSPFNDKGKTFKSVLKALKKWPGSDNPYWNFEWMKSLEEKNGFNSVWYFLSKGLKHRDAYYTYDEPRIKKLIQYLKDCGDEIGLHATFAARNDKQIMSENMRELTRALGYPPEGVRQHWLNFEYPQTLRLQEQLGLKYDSSWGFADHWGWRNGYCHPFRPYDLEKDRMMDIWEFPLCVMDGTLFDYQKLSVADAGTVLQEIIDQVLRYRGLLVLLWHNSYFDEEIHEGITRFYSDVLDQLRQNGLRSYTPIKVLRQLEMFAES